MKISFPGSILVFIINLFFCHTVLAEMYRWVDEAGRVYYSDQVPPKSNKYERQKLTDTARVLETTTAEKPESQKSLNQRLTELRQAQQKVLAEQQDLDKVLLNTFQTENDMKLALNGKLQSIKAKQKLSEGNLKRLGIQLHAQQKEAANHERKGSRIPDQILKEIKATEQQMILADQDLVKLDREIYLAKQQYDKDLKRFRYLKQSKQLSQHAGDNKQATSKDRDIGLFDCQSLKHCEKAWDVAKLFVQNNSATVVELDSKKLLLTRNPGDETKYSLSLARLENKKGKIQIFLDIRCYPSSLGDKLCSSQKLLGLRADFVPFIEALLPPE